MQIKVISFLLYARTENNYISYNAIITIFKITFFYQKFYSSVYFEVNNSVSSPLSSSICISGKSLTEVIPK